MNKFECLQSDSSSDEKPNIPKIHKKKITKKQKSKKYLKQKDLEIKAKVFVNNTIKYYYPDIEKIKLKIEEEITNKKTNYISYIIDELCVYHLHEIFSSPKILDSLKHYHQIGNYCSLFIVNQPIYICKQIEGLKRTNDDCIKMVDLMYSIGELPIKKNFKKETVIESLYKSFEKGYINVEQKDKLYEIYTNPPNSIIKKCCNIMLNIITDTNINNLKNKILWLLVLKTDIFIETVIDRCLRTYNYLKKDGYFESINKFISIIKKIINYGPDVNDINYKTFFEKNIWNKEVIMKKFNDTLLNKTCSLDIDKLSLSHDYYSCNIIGAIIGETDNVFEQINYMKKCLDIGTDIMNSNFIVCLAHSVNIWKYDISQLLNKIDNKKNNFESWIKFALHNIIENNKIDNNKLSINKIDNKSDTDIINNMYYNKMNFIKNITNINEKSKFEITINNDIVPNELDDIAYSMKLLFTNNTQKQLYQAFIIKICEIVTKQYQIDGINFVIKNLITQKIFNFNMYINTLINMSCQNKKNEIKEFLDAPLTSNIIDNLYISSNSLIY